MTACSSRRWPSHTAVVALLLLLAGMALALAAPAPAQQPEQDQDQGRAQEQEEPWVDRYGDLVSVFSGDLHVPAGVRQHGNVVCIGGKVVVEGQVTRQVVSILGSLRLERALAGEVVGILSDLELRNAQVSGPLVSVGGSIQLENSAVEDEMVNVLSSLDRDRLSRAAGEMVNIGFGSLWTVLFWIRLFHKFLIFLLLVALVLLVPERIRTISDELPVRFLKALFVGLLGYLGFLALFSLLLLTVVGAPVVLIAFAVLKWMGIAAIFHAVGRGLGRTFGLSLSLLGGVLLCFTLYAVVFMAPAAWGVVGLVLTALLRLAFWLLVELPAVGLVLLSRAGGRRSGSAAVPDPPVPGVPAPAGDPAT